MNWDEMNDTKLHELMDAAAVINYEISQHFPDAVSEVKALRDHAKDYAKRFQTAYKLAKQYRDADAPLMAGGEFTSDDDTDESDILNAGAEPRYNPQQNNQQQQQNNRPTPQDEEKKQKKAKEGRQKSANKKEEKMRKKIAETAEHEAQGDLDLQRELQDAMLAKHEDDRRNEQRRVEEAQARNATAIENQVLAAAQRGHRANVAAATAAHKKLDMQAPSLRGKAVRRSRSRENQQQLKEEEEEEEEQEDREMTPDGLFATPAEQRAFNVKVQNDIKAWNHEFALSPVAFVDLYISNANDFLKSPANRSHARSSLSGHASAMQLLANDAEMLEDARALERAWRDADRNESVTELNNRLGHIGGMMQALATTMRKWKMLERDMNMATQLHEARVDKEARKKQRRDDEEATLQQQREQQRQLQEQQPLLVPNAVLREVAQHGVGGVFANEAQVPPAPASEPKNKKKKKEENNNDEMELMGDAATEAAMKKKREEREKKNK